MTIYLLDTNALTDYMKKHAQFMAKMAAAIQANHHLCMTPPVYYEIVRGLMHKKASAQLTKFRQQIIPQFEWIALEKEDWFQAGTLWADARSRGRQLSDVDLLLAAMALRRNAVIVSADNDFDALSVKRENCQESTP